MVNSKDNELIFRIADTFARDIEGAKKVVIPGTAHHPTMERPQEFNRAVLDFLAQLNLTGKQFGLGGLKLVFGEGSRLLELRELLQLSYHVGLR